MQRGGVPRDPINIVFRPFYFPLHFFDHLFFLTVRYASFDVKKKI